jgi:hypothetical protein
LKIRLRQWSVNSPDGWLLVFTGEGADKNLVRAIAIAIYGRARATGDIRDEGMFEEQIPMEGTN